MRNYLQFIKEHKLWGKSISEFLNWVKGKSDNVLGSMKLVNMLERAFRACNIKEKDIKWKITERSTGQGYGEFFIYVEFKVEE